MKIAVYTIAKNEEQFVKRWYESAKDADYLLIADTGSEDNTVDIAMSLGINVIVLNINPWRFDKARNMALQALPVDIDICIALDMDEVLQSGWRKQLESVPKGYTRPRYRYTWSWKPDGSPDLVYGGDKIHARHGYKWKHPVHEVITPEIEEHQYWTGLEIHHYPDHTKSRSQYFPLLELAVEEDPSNDRNLFYLGREYYYYNMPEKAIDTFNKYLQIAKWQAERCAAYRFMAKCSPEHREEYLLKAIQESPRKEALLELASYYYQQNDWQNCYIYSYQAYEITEKPLDYLCEGWAWEGFDLDLLAISAWNLNKVDEAVKFGTQAVLAQPENERLKANLKFYKEKVDGNTSRNGG